MYFFILIMIFILFVAKNWMMIVLKFVLIKHAMRILLFWFICKWFWRFLRWLPYSCFKFFSYRTSYNMTEFNMKLDNVKIKTCCFLSIWKKAKEDQEYWETLDNGNLDGKKFICRFYTSGLMFHCCYDCLRDIVFKKNFTIVSFLDWLRDSDSNPNIVSDVGCMKEVLHLKRKISEICQTFIINQISDSEIYIL